VKRNILAGVSGAAAAFVIIWLLELAGTVIFPPPPGLDFTNPQAVRAAMANIPLGALVCVLIAQLAGTFSGAWVAARIARRAQAALAMTVGVLAMVAGIGNMLMIPHPVWFWVASLLLCLPSAYLGGLLARRIGIRTKLLHIAGPMP
jgi:hypothetical protein